MEQGNMKMVQTMKK